MSDPSVITEITFISAPHRPQVSGSTSNTFRSSRVQLLRLWGSGGPSFGPDLGDLPGGISIEPALPVGVGAEIADQVGAFFRNLIGDPSQPFKGIQREAGGAGAVGGRNVQEDLAILTLVDPVQGHRGPHRVTGHVGQAGRLFIQDEVAAIQGEAAAVAEAEQTSTPHQQQSRGWTHPDYPSANLPPFAARFQPRPNR